MSMRDFLARLSTPLSPSLPPTIAPIIPIRPADATQTPAADTLRNGTRTAQLNTITSTILREDDAPFYWDIETRSAAKLGKGKDSVGARAYAEHPSTEVLCVTFARGDGQVEIWTPPDPAPAAVLTAAAQTHCKWIAHNAAFERAILECILIPRHGWPPVPVDRHVCTMALALSHAYPGSLEAVAKILGLVNRKDTAREKNIRKMWKPRKPRRGEDPNRIYWVDSPELRTQLHLYAKQDTATERELHQRLPALPAAEQDIWVIDAEINDRGVRIDAPLAAAACVLAKQAHAELDERIRRETDGAVDKASKQEKLKAWLMLQGVKLPRRPKKQKSGLRWENCLEADDIEKLLAEDLPHPGVRAALEARLQAAQSAASKVTRMLQTRCADERVRNLYRIYGAVTGRWSGEGFQPQNLKRPEWLQSDEAIAEAVEMVLTGDYAAIKKRYGDVLGLIGDLCRSMLIPASGHRFIIGDFNAIEARVLALLAGDANKLESFRQFDCGTGREIYCITAEQILGRTDVQSKSPERALGKVFELALGYAMGGDKLLATIRKANIPGTAQITATDTARWVQKWRWQNPAIVGYWAMLERAAKEAVYNPGMIVPCRAISFIMREGVLVTRLPSGRELSYPRPEIKPGRFGSNQITFLDMEAGRQRGKQMYGGKWAENVTSAVARDLLVEAMKRLRAASYVLVLHTHDEIVAEMPIGRGSVAEFHRLLVEVPDWAHGLPIAAKVFEADRFKKD